MNISLDPGLVDAARDAGMRIGSRADERLRITDAIDAPIGTA